MLGLLVGTTAPLHAGNNCPSATALPLTGGPCTLSLATSTPLGGGCPSPVATPVPPCAGGCDDQVWFRFQANDAFNQYDVAFSLQIYNNPGAASDFKYYLLYAEGSDSGNGDPCSWISPAPAPFTVRQGESAGCVSVPANGTQTVSFNTYGLDGTAIYYLVIERVTGTGGSVDACATTLASGPPPANDRCNSPIPLTAGNGIDSQSALGGSGTWADAALGTNRFATKQRITSECSGAVGSTTEDHYFVPGGSCASNEPMGQGQKIIVFPFVFGDCVESLESTVYYEFAKPATDPPDDWYLHIGNTNCATASKALDILLLETWDCDDASSAQVVECKSFVASMSYPSADVLLGPFDLMDFQDYLLIIDGENGSQCDYRILLTRSPINPVLPAGITAFTAEAAGAEAVLRWEATGATHFEVARSTDGHSFVPVAEVPAQAGDAYTYTEALPPGVRHYYRLRAVDANGGETYSTVQTVNRVPVRLALQARGGESLRLTTALPDATAPATVEVRDLTGRLLHREVVAGHTTSLTLSRAGWPRSLYLISLRQHSQQAVLKWSGQ